jgi:hypothetical protein
MEILEVGVSEYSEVIRAPYHSFGSASFNNLNRDKSDNVYYLLFREGKFRLGLIGGCREKKFYSPFSAPFGGFSYVSEDIRLQYIEEAIKLLIEWSASKGFISVSITLPPAIYKSSFISKQTNCLWRGGFEISKIDLNYSFDTEEFDEKYTELIWYNARKNLNIAMNSNLKFLGCNTDQEKSLAYDIICSNRESRGFPLRMTWKQVSETVEIIDADFFLVQNEFHKSFASAIVFHVSETVIQVVYWGDIPGFSELKPMNYMAYKIFEYYNLNGRKIVDIGPSTEDSNPNYGLCEFKESIGCSIDPKFTFTRKII